MHPCNACSAFSTSIGVNTTGQYGTNSGAAELSVQDGYEGGDGETQQAQEPGNAQEPVKVQQQEVGEPEQLVLEGEQEGLDVEDDLPDLDLAAVLGVPEKCIQLSPCPDEGVARAEKIKQLKTLNLAG